jgi:hypothetical protein
VGTFKPKKEALVTPTNGCYKGFLAPNFLSGGAIAAFTPG